MPPYGANHVQPHNAIVQFLLSWGLIPSIPLLALIGWATWRVHRIARAVPRIVPLVMMLDCLLVMRMVDGMLYFAGFVMLIVTLYALCFAAGRQPNR